jgi:hypothetical protein
MPLTATPTIPQSTITPNPLGEAEATNVVYSFNGRTGTVVPVAGDYSASDITNDSTVTGTNVDDALETLDSDISTHIADTANPHSVTKAQVGLSAVENTALSTWAGTTNITTLGTIATGTWNATAITWAKVSKTGSNLNEIETRSHTVLTDIGSNTHAQIDTHIANTSNPHSVTAAQIGAPSGRSNLTTQYRGVFVDSAGVITESSSIFTNASGFLNISTSAIGDQLAITTTGAYSAISIERDSDNDQGGTQKWLLVSGAGGNTRDFSIENSTDGTEVLRIQESSSALLIGTMTQYASEKLGVNGDGYFNGSVSASVLTAGADNDDTTAALNIIGDDYYSSAVFLQRYEASSSGPGITTVTGRGTPASQTQALQLDDLFYFDMFAVDNVGGYQQAAGIVFELREDCTTSQCGSQMEIYITPDGTTTRKEMLTLKPAELILGEGISSGNPLLRIHGYQGVSKYSGTIGMSSTVADEIEVKAIDSVLLECDSGDKLRISNDGLMHTGASRRAVESITGNTTLDATHRTVICTTNAFTVTLPPAATYHDATLGVGIDYVIKNAKSNTGNTITVDGDGAETIDGATTISLAPGESITITTDGTEWHIIEA